VSFLVELPGIEPAALPGIMPAELQIRYVSFRFSAVRYLRFRSRVLTPSRAVNPRDRLFTGRGSFGQLPLHRCGCCVSLQPLFYVGTAYINACTLLRSRLTLATEPAAVQPV
jgi:hypothetical protein